MDRRVNISTEGHTVTTRKKLDRDEWDRRYIAQMALHEPGGAEELWNEEVYDKLSELYPDNPEQAVDDAWEEFYQRVSGVPGEKRH
jgi:hypothetical protein